MASLPYVTSPGNIERALNGIKAAAVPAKVSQDFVKTILKIPGGSGTQITSFLKKIGFANSDSSPSDLYKKFRNPSVSGQAVAAAIREAYAALYIRNEFMHELSDQDLIGLITEETGQAHDSNPVKLIFSSIKQLKSFADFSETEAPIVRPMDVEDARLPPPNAHPSPAQPQSFGLNLGYTINLNLPATTDPEVFDAIFKSLKSHLLQAADG